MAAMNNTKSSAIDRMATIMPLLLPDILEFIVFDHCDDQRRTSKSHHWRGDLLRCGLVNEIWFIEAMKMLWKEPVPSAPREFTLSILFSKIEPTRRQFYANFVERAVEYATASNPTGTLYHALEDLNFPKLSTLELWLENDQVPKIQGAALASLTLSPHYEGTQVHYFYQHTLAKILDQIAGYYPDLKELRFPYTALAFPGTLEKFAARMLKLENFEHPGIWISQEPCTGRRMFERYHESAACHKVTS